MRFPAIILTFALALSACDEAVDVAPPLERARASLASGDGFGAELALRDAMAQGAERSEVAALMGEAELLQGQIAEARKWLGSGEFAEDTAGRGFLMLGRLEMRVGNLPAAGAAYDRSLSYMPDDADLWVDIARLRYRGGEQAQAVDAAMRAIELGPDNPEALLLRGQLARDSEGMAAALPFFERALSKQPDNLDLLADYSATLAELGRARESLAAARKVIAIDPGYVRAYFIQSVIAARGGKFGLARKLLMRSGDFGRDVPAGILLGGVIDLEQGNYASAAQAFDRLHRLQPENRQVRELLARALSLGGNDRELLHRFDAEARLVSASPYLRTVVARAHEANGARDQAAALIDRTGEALDGSLVAMQPTIALDVSARRGIEQGEDALSIVRGRIVTGDRTGAIGAAEAFAQRYTGSADAAALLGDARLANRQLGPALEAYDRAARIRRPWPLTRRMIATLRASGKRGGAVKLAEAQLAGNPSNGELASLLARFSYDAGEFDRAAALLDQAIRHGFERDPEVLSLRALVAKRRGDDGMAVRYALRAIEILPHYSNGLQAFAMVQGGDAAQIALAKARTLDGGTALASR